MKWLAVLLLILVPFNAQAAGAFLNSGTSGPTAGSSHSASVTIPAGTDLFVVLCRRAILDINSPAAPTAATVNGLSMTAVAATPTAEQNQDWVRMFFYLTPPTGAQTVVCNGGGGTALDTGFLWSAYSGFAQSGQPDSSNATNWLTTAALALQTTVVGSKCWVMAGFGSQNLTGYSISNGTSRITATQNGAAGIADSNAIVTAGSYTITANWTSQRANGLAASFCESGSAFNPYYFWDF